MLFKPHLAEAILQRKKTQTRRLLPQPSGCTTVLANDTITEVYRHRRLLWELGKTYAIQPGPAKKAIARFRLLAIRLQPLQNITPTDAIAEGITHRSDCHDPIALFAELWNHTHTTPGTRWQDNPQVLALTFELVPPQQGETP